MTCLIRCRRAHDPARSERAELVWSADSRRPKSTHTFDLGAREPLWIVSLGHEIRGWRLSGPTKLRPSKAATLRLVTRVLGLPHLCWYRFVSLRDLLVTNESPGSFR